MPRYVAASKFPAVERDLALIVAPHVPAADVEAAVRAGADGVVASVRVFDEYRGPQVAEGKKSLAVRVVLQRFDGTLTDAEADGYITAILTVLRERCNATLRELACSRGHRRGPTSSSSSSLLFGALRGFKRGLVRELAGAIALVFAIAAAFHYPGIWDAFMRDRFHLNFAAAHVVGMLAYAGAAYVVVLALGAALSIVAQAAAHRFGEPRSSARWSVQPKRSSLVWGILYVLLFFPLAPSLRADLRRSAFVAFLQQPTHRLDTALRSSLPSFLQPLADPLFAQHDR